MKRSRTVSLLGSSLEDNSRQKLSQVDEVLVKEFVAGSEFFGTISILDVGDLSVPPNLHTPFPPPFFQVLYDLSARTEFTTLVDFPP